MTEVQLSPEAFGVLEEAARLRGLDLSQTLAEAIGLERQVAGALDRGADIVIAKQGEPMQQLLFAQAKTTR